MRNLRYTVYPTIGEMIKVLDKNGLDELGIGDPQAWITAIEITKNLAVFLHQILIVLR
jgi:hypothetical protein